MSNVKVPGIAWVALITVLATWIGTYVDSPYTAAIVIALGAVGKIVEMYITGQAAAKIEKETPPVNAAGMPRSQSTIKMEANAQVGRPVNYSPGIDFFLG